MEKRRLLFIDNLRVLMITLVILVHLSVTYGGEGSWYYKEGAADTLSSMLLTWHNATAQSFFMGFLFLIAAYLTPGSFERKGPRRFLGDRFLRLGIPLLFYDFVINPLLIVLLMKTGVYDARGSLRDLAVGYYTDFRIGTGPLWFVEVLLIFAVVYAAGRAVCKRNRSGPARQLAVPHLHIILTFAVVLGVLSFVVRIWLPVGWSFRPLNLQFPFFVQYIAMPIVGLVAYRHDWFARLPRSMMATCLALAGVLVIGGFPLLFFLGGALEQGVSNFAGGVHWQALLYALWEQVAGMTMIVGLLVLFRDHLNRQGTVAREAGAASYAVYILHTPVIVLLALAVRDIRLYPLLKFALAALIAVPLCLTLAAALGRLPFAQRIL